jgi:hypothetical protein
MRHWRGKGYSDFGVGYFVEDIDWDFHVNGPRTTRCKVGEGLSESIANFVDGGHAVASSDDGINSSLLIFELV